jgi:Uma2 family endonuclease
MVTYPIVLGPEFDVIPDDTEETLVGSHAHQGAIVTAVDGLQICARRRDLPWFIGNQIFLLVPQAGRTIPRRLAPDVCVYRSLAVTDPTSIEVAQHGPPTLALEIASPRTAIGSDINLFDPDGKPQLYAQIGIAEYLVFDPTGALVREAVWALRRGPDGFGPWEPEADGRWHSTLGVSFAPQGMLLRVYDHDGRLVPLTTEFDAMLIERERALAEQLRRSAEQDQRLAALEAELRRLRGEPT